MALWRQKVIIISITLFAAVLTGIYSMYIISPVYQTKLRLVINMPETYLTQYGEYILPLTNNQQYVNLITSNDIMAYTINDMDYNDNGMVIEDLMDKIIISPINAVNEKQNNFEIIVSANDPAEAKLLAQTLYDNYVEFIDVMTTESVTTYFLNDFTVKLRTLNEKIEANNELIGRNEILLENTPKTINQKDAMQEIEAQKKMTEFIVLENIINPNYTKIENDIITLKQTNYDLENSVKLYNTYIDELDVLSSELRDYQQLGEFKNIKSNILNIAETNIYLPSAPVAPNRKSGPNNTKNVLAGTIVGGMIAVLIALAKEYLIKRKV